MRSTTRRARASMSSTLGQLAPQRRHGARRGAARRAPQAPRRRTARTDSGSLCHRAQHVEADDVARAFPDAVERRLAIEPRHHRLLDVAVAAEALERLGRVHRRALAQPVLAHRRRQPREAARLAVASAPRRRRAPAAPSSPSPPPTRAPDRRARSASAAGRRAACRTPRDAPRGASPAPRRGASRRRRRCSSRAACGSTISMMVGTPRPSSPTSRAQAPSNSTSLDAFERLPSLSLSRCRWIAFLRAVGPPARHQEARQPALGLRQHEERVAHRRRAEPLVSDERRSASPLPCVARVVLARTSRAALLLGHRHAAQRALLLARPGRLRGS